MANTANGDIWYEQLPDSIKDNLSREQWHEAQQDLIADGQPVPETTAYVNVKNGQISTYQVGDRARGPLLPAHDLSGAHGKDDTQFHTTPPGARGEG